MRSPTRRIIGASDGWTRDASRQDRWKSAAECLAAWRVLMLIGSERALRLDMMGWMERREFEQRRRRQPIDFHARTRQLFQETEEMFRRHAAVIIQQPNTAIAPAAAGVRGLSLRKARSLGLIRPHRPENPLWGAKPSSHSGSDSGSV